jgi:hypothetical protein
MFCSQYGYIGMNMWKLVMCDLFVFYCFFFFNSLNLHRMFCIWNKFFRCQTVRFSNTGEKDKL